MKLTDQVNDLIEQSQHLLSPVPMDDWTPPPGPPEDVQRAWEAEETRRYHARVDAYLADRSDRLSALKAICQSAKERSDRYEDMADPWLRLARRQKGLAAYVEQLARNVLETERLQAGYTANDAYQVTQPNGTKIGLRLSPPSVRILDESLLPPAFIAHEPRVLKSAISTALKAGQEVPGATLERGTHLHWK